MKLKKNPRFNLEKSNSGNGNLYVVVVQSAEKKVGLVVDKLMGQQEGVIKSIGSALSNLPGIAGACELGENQAVLVIDIGSLLDKVTTGRTTQTGTKAEKNV